MQGQQVDRARGDLGQRLEYAQRLADLPLARQEHQHVARMLRQRLLEAAPQLEDQRFVATRREVRHRHREAAPRRRQARRLEPRGQGFAGERGRHHHQPQVRSPLRLDVERQRQPEVAAEVAFVEFVEDDRRHAVQGWIVLDQPGQDAFGQHLDAGGR